MKENRKKNYAKEELGRMIRFGLVGVLNTGVDFFVYWLFAAFWGFNVFFAQASAYFIATLHSYIWNRSWTFQSKKSFFGQQLWQFFTVNFISLGTSLVLLYYFHSVMGMDKLFAKIPIAFFTLAINYLGNRLWVFYGAKEK